jgi:hypothetical protein
VSESQGDQRGGERQSRDGEEGGMAELTYEALLDYRRRLQQGETDIETEAERHTLDELAEGLLMTRGMLEAITIGWTQEQLWAQPPHADMAAEGEDRWSATQALTHIMATQNWYFLHMDRLLGQRRQYEVMVRGLGDLAETAVAKDELVAQLHDATERIVAYIAAIPPDADLAARRDSTFFGELSLRGWVMLAINHDLDHLLQIERVAALPSFPR